MDRVLVGKLVGKLFCARCNRETIHVLSRPRKVRWKDNQGENWRSISDAMCVNCGGTRPYVHKKGGAK